MKILIRNRLFWGTTVLMLAAGATYGCKDFLVTPAQGTLAETTLSTKAGVEGRQRLTIHAPLMTLTKAQIIRRGLDLGVDFGLTWSCYDPEPNGAACGRCDSCRLRLKGFAEAGVRDPVQYAPSAPSAAPAPSPAQP